MGDHGIPIDFGKFDHDPSACSPEAWFIMVFRGIVAKWIHLPRFMDELWKITIFNGKIHYFYGHFQ